MICVALQEKDTDKCLEALKNIELAEIRIDLAEYSAEDVQKVFSQSHAKLIATCRPDNYTATQQETLLKTAIDAGAAYVDVEIEASKTYKNSIISYAKTRNCTVIVSYHNYTSTPSTDELKKIIDTCLADGADIAKLATTAQTPKDSARILGLYAYAPNAVLLGMGEAGKITRIAATKLGAPFTFAALSNDTATAPGQMSKAQLEKMYELIS